MKRLPASQPPGIAAVLAAGVLVVAVLNLNVPYFAITPGPVQDVTQLIKIEGAETDLVDGQLLLTTVSLHTIRVAEAVRGWIDPSVHIVSRVAVIPSGQSEEQVQKHTTQQMDQSQFYAAAAALAYLGYEVNLSGLGARVIKTDEPASALLQPGDVIVGAGGRPTSNSEEIIAEIQKRSVGDEIAFDLIREDETIQVSVRTIGRPQDPDVPIVGVALEDVRAGTLPLAVDIDSRGIGGPSAGLMFALGIIELLDGSDLAKGRVVAGTGDIGERGGVGPVGGIRQKVESARRARAELFIVPLIELKDACSVARGLPMVGVEDLNDAVEALRGGAIEANRSCE